MSERAARVEGFEGRKLKGTILRGGGLVEEEVSGERRARDQILWRSSKGRCGKGWKDLGRVFVLGMMMVLEGIVVGCGLVLLGWMTGGWLAVKGGVNGDSYI
jgi:hypothetical protein